MIGVTLLNLVETASRFGNGAQNTHRVTEWSESQNIVISRMAQQTRKKAIIGMPHFQFIHEVCSIEQEAWLVIIGVLKKVQQLELFQEMPTLNCRL